MRIHQQASPAGTGKELPPMRVFSARLSDARVFVFGDVARGKAI
ncbi:hypothetical protein [Thalassococcus arenae]|nr:hypothetical protein [Thalassococcus arenae]